MGRKRTAPKSRTRGITATDYTSVLTEMKDRIAAARHRALATVNQELVSLYWDIGRIIIRQQEHAAWGDAVVEQLATDLRAAFPDMKGLTNDNIWRMRQFFVGYRDLDGWLVGEEASVAPHDSEATRKLATLSRELGSRKKPGQILATVSRELRSSRLAPLMLALSWSHHKEILAVSDSRAERYFYMAMSARKPVARPGALQDGRRRPSATGTHRSR